MSGTADFLFVSVSTAHLDNGEHAPKMFQKWFFEFIYWVIALFLW